MKRRYWIILIAIFIFVDIVIFYLLSPTSPEQDIPTESPEQEEETSSSPNFTIPGSPGTMPGSSGGAPGGSGGSEGGEGGEGGFGGSGGEPGEEELPPVNYTLYLDTVPSFLKLFVNYRVNGFEFNITETAPFSVEIDGYSTACVLVASKLTGQGVLKWFVDGEEVQATECYPPFSGCGVFMDSDHNVLQQWIPEE